MDGICMTKYLLFLICSAHDMMAGWAATSETRRTAILINLTCFMDSQIEREKRKKKMGREMQTKE